MYGNEIEKYTSAGATMPIDCRVTLRERLMGEKAAMERRILQINEALGLLDRNPDFERLQDIIR